MSCLLTKSREDLCWVSTCALWRSDVTDSNRKHRGMEGEPWSRWLPLIPSFPPAPEPISSLLHPALSSVGAHSWGQRHPGALTSWLLVGFHRKGNTRSRRPKDGMTERWVISLSWVSGSRPLLPLYNSYCAVILQISSCYWALVTLFPPQVPSALGVVMASH